jgi:O-antigen/teichoic acid export membrane protein
MSLRALARGSALYTLGTFLPRLGALLLLPVYTMTLDPAAFGVVSLMLSVSTLLAIVYRLGLDGALLRLHFDLSPKERPRLYATLTTISVVVTIGASTLLGLAAAPFFSRLFTGISFLPFGLLTLAITSATALQYVPTVFYRATERPGRFLAYSGAIMVAGIMATVVFLVELRLGAVGALLGQLLGGIIGLLIGAVVLMRLRPLRFEPGLARSGLAFGLPLVPHSISGWILNVSDRWLLGLLLGVGAIQAQAAIGVYSLGYQLAQAVSLVALSFNAAWGPFFYARGESRHGPALLREMTTVVAALLGALAVALAVAGPEIIRVMAPASWGSARDQAADVLRVVALASFIYSVYFMVSSAIFLTRRTALLPLLTVSAGAANVVLNLLLIPRVGIMGAAWSTVVGYTILAVGAAIYATRGYPLRLDLARLGVLAAAGIGVGWLTRALLPSQPSIEVVATHVVAIVAFAALAWLLLRAPVARLRTLVAATSPPPDAAAVLG